MSEGGPGTSASEDQSRVRPRAVGLWKLVKKEYITHAMERSQSHEIMSERGPRTSARTTER